MEEGRKDPRFGAGACLLAGFCLLLAIPMPNAALALAGSYLIFRGYAWWVESGTGPLDDGEVRLMKVGEEGEPDRPVRISDMSQSEADPSERD